MVTGCETEWAKESSDSTTLSATAGVEVGVASAEASAEKGSETSKSKNTKGRQAYGTTYCNFYEVQLGANYKDDSNDFNCKGPKTFTTCGNECSKLFKCKKVDKLDCHAQFINVSATLMAIYFAA